MFMSGTEPFTFSDYINLLPADLVFERFVKRLATPRKIISASMVKEIAAHFSMEKNLLAIFSTLSPEAQYTCSLAYLYGAGGAPFKNMRFDPSKAIVQDAGDLLEAQGYLQPNTTSGEGFDDELVRSFLVYAGRDSQGAMFYAGFEEFEPGLRKTCAQVIMKRTQIQPEKEALAFSPYLCLNDVSVVVALASQGKLLKTKSGSLSKISNVNITKLLYGAHSLFDTGRKDLSPVSVALGYAVKRGLLLGQDASIASHQRMCAWLLEPIEARYAEIVDFAFSSYPLWNKNMIEEMLFKPGKPWLSAKAFGETRKDDANAHFKMLAYCGLIDFYRSGNDCVYTRSKQHGAVPTAPKRLSQRPVMLQADFSAMLPQETSPDHLYWFSKVGSFGLLDTVYRGTVAKDVVCNSLSEGIAGEQLLGKLAEWGAPANVTETVREWIREFARVSFITGSIVVSAEAKVTKQLSEYATLGCCIERIRADGVFRVIEGKEDIVAKTLLAMGFDPRPSLKREHEALPINAAVDGYMDATPVARLTPVVDFEIKEPFAPVIVKQGKYSAHLKALELTELMHVIDYALLMGNRVRIDYAGSPGLRKGTYVIRPLTYKKGLEPQIEAQSGKTNAKKSFMLAKIKKIGVESGDG